MKNMIEVTDKNLNYLVKKAYSLSRPQGMGFLHYIEDDELTTKEAQSLIDFTSKVPVSMDYIKGRACKFTVFNYDGKLFIRDSWYDHSESDLEELLR